MARPDSRPAASAVTTSDRHRDQGRPDPRYDEDRRASDRRELRPDARREPARYESHSDLQPDCSRSSASTRPSDSRPRPASPSLDLKDLQPPGDHFRPPISS